MTQGDSVLVNQLLNPIKRRLQLMVDRAVLRLINDEAKRQRLQIQTLAGETASDVERWQNYGHTSVPPEGSEAITLALNGNRSKLVVICAEDKAVRLKGLKDGDSALYHLEGHYLKLTKDGVAELMGDELNIVVKRVNITAEESVDITTPSTTISGDVEIGGNTTIKGNATIAGSATAKTVVGQEGGTFAGVKAESHQHKENGKDNLTDPPKT